MGTQIEATARVQGSLFRGRGARRLSDRAVKHALERAHLAPDDVELLINVGMFHDGMLGEPALAAIIQEDVRANPENPHEGAHGTFSFDLANGACGALTALEVVDGFLRAGTVRHAVIVAGDADPGHGLAPRFPFDPAGAALVCGYSDGPGGLGTIRFARALGAGESGRATVGFEHGRNVLTIDHPPELLYGSARLAAELVREVLAAERLTLDDVDAVVCGPNDPRFLATLCTALSLDEARVISPAPSLHLHTTGLVAALEAALMRFADRHARFLLVDAGAGPVAGAAMLTR